MEGDQKGEKERGEYFLQILLKCLRILRILLQRTVPRERDWLRLHDWKVVEIAADVSQNYPLCLVKFRGVAQKF